MDMKIYHVSKDMIRAVIWVILSSVEDNQERAVQPHQIIRYTSNGWIKRQSMIKMQESKGEVTSLSHD